MNFERSISGFDKKMICSDEYHYDKRVVKVIKGFIDYINLITISSMELINIYV
jgi:hypothetical protein